MFGLTISALPVELAHCIWIHKVIEYPNVLEIIGLNESSCSHYRYFKMIFEIAMF